MIKSLNSSTVVKFPLVFTESSVLSPDIFPDGKSTFCFSNAFLTSKGVSL